MFVTWKVGILKHIPHLRRKDTPVPVYSYAFAKRVGDDEYQLKSGENVPHIPYKSVKRAEWKRVYEVCLRVIIVLVS